MSVLVRVLAKKKKKTGGTLILGNLRDFNKGTTNKDVGRV